MNTWASTDQQWYKSQGNRPPYSTQTMRDPNFIDEQRNADIMDAMADLAYEQEQAMREEYEINPPELEVYDDQA